MISFLSMENPPHTASATIGTDWGTTPVVFFLFNLYFSSTTACLRIQILQSVVLIRVSFRLVLFLIKKAFFFLLLLLSIFESFLRFSFLYSSVGIRLTCALWFLVFFTYSFFGAKRREKKYIIHQNKNHKKTKQKGRNGSVVCVLFFFR